MADCCNDFARTELFRRAAAEAGSGLPAIEPGMPTPAGTGLSRRRFLARSAGLALKAAAVAVLWVWLARAELRLTALALGLIIGGAFGNAIDRIAYGAVVDFVLFHIKTPSFSFVWYVFNLADAAIVAGVIGLLYEYVLGAAPQKRPDPP